MSDRLRILLIIIVTIGAIVAVRMIHRKKLNLGYSLLWLFLAMVMIVAVLFPDLVYSLTALVGIDIPLNLILTGFALFSLMMMFYLTCIVSRDNERNRALTQQVALLEKRVRDLEERLSNEERQQ